MKANNENDFLKVIEDSFKIVSEKIDTFCSKLEQASDTKETKIWLDNLKKADELFEDLLKEKIEAVKNIIKKHK